MSGHSKWSKVKHQKEATDAVKGKIFTKIANAIIVAVKEGGGIKDPESNFKLRLIVEKARSLNMPKENIERAIERAAGGGEGEEINEIVYEAFGPAGVGIIIEAATNNKQRTVSDLKNVLERGGGVLATTGAVSHLFKYVGLITIPKTGNDNDKVMEQAIDAGAIDIDDTGDDIEVYTEPKDVHKIKETLSQAGVPVSSFELYYRPVTSIPVNDSQTAQKVLSLLTSLEELEDVQKVFANFDIPDNLLH
ncbi:YebC/PmpR family DNA-binding transcriptional regulator [Patescibacteria group bacterium]|nr:YebC/PmpR family DNA-binding transcriptional regulator [Patescibacteria group bacterium]MCL5797522.1 YebC/PmpR family DNA-binding transcriptional regulator [Patescibacteria group bacterium]